MGPLTDASKRLRGHPGRPLGDHVDYEETRAALPKAMSVKKAAQYSGISYRAIWRLLKDGTLRRVKIPGVGTLVLTAELDQILEEGAQR